MGKILYKTEEEDKTIVARVAEPADRYGVTMTSVALACHFARGVLAPIVGATKEKYLDDAAETFSLTLTPEDVAYLEEPYLPHKVTGALPVR